MMIKLKKDKEEYHITFSSGDIEFSFQV